MKTASIIKYLQNSNVLFHMVRRGLNLGYCPICEKRTAFFKQGDWLRDQYRCIRCNSIPRWRAIIYVLQELFPNWRQLRIHESSPGGPTFRKLSIECVAYVPTHFFPGVQLGTIHRGFRCEDLARQTFPDESFDLVITQDVVEHLLKPCQAFKEICRTLKPGGAHVFTVPWYYWQETKVRAVGTDTENIDYFEKPEYHGNPIDPSGSLVVTEWGKDLCDTIYASSRMTTTVIRIKDRKLGIDAKFIEVFVSIKPSHSTSGLTNRWSRG